MTNKFSTQMKNCVSGKIPAGIADTNIEFFAKDERLFYFLDGVTIPFSEWPEELLALIEQDMAKNPKAIESLVHAGIESRHEMIQQYIRCRYSALDNQPDLVNGKFQEPEYADCKLRGFCPYEGKLCLPIKALHGTLTHREIEVLRLIPEGLLDKEIADQLGISPLTVPVHMKNLREKTGAKNKSELVRFAYQKNLF